VATLVDASVDSARPLIVLAGPTASGKTALSLALAERFNGEIVSCDSVAVYRGMEIGSAKPSLAERARVPHHMLDIALPSEPCTAGDYSRKAREAVREIAQRNRLPIVAGGTGLYLRALLDGLFPAPPRHEPLREKLRQRAQLRGSAHLHRILARLDPAAARLIHPNDAPKIIRAIEVTLASRPPAASDSRTTADEAAPGDAPAARFLPITVQWQQPHEPLTGFRVLRLALNPPRAELYARINLRAAQMFETGLVEETAQLLRIYGNDCRALTSLGYAQAAALLHGEISREEAIAQAQQGHRNYAKRQLTWFRKDSALHWLVGFGGDDAIQQQALALVAQHLAPQ
jgi:tRNA dimethylallyltransferase